MSLFLRAAESFSKAVNSQHASQKIDVEIMTLNDYSIRYNNGVEVTKHELLGLMNEGKIEMSQLYTTWLAEEFNSDMHVLDMPFLFRDHDHAQTVLEGEIGEELLSGITRNSHVHGLSFTYSGGFRMIPATKALRSIDDFKDTMIRSNKNPFAMETFRAVGAIPVPCELEEINDGVADGRFVGGESAWPRVYPLGQNIFSTVMNDTKHSLFLTSMIVRKDFWASLDIDLQQIMKNAAVAAAREERAESIRDGEQAKQKAISEGIEVVALGDECTEKFVAASQSVYEKFEDFFTPGLVDSIKKH
jgi:TRAP-type C4-dicarboxylate transport system substrate-binding protein